MLRMTLVPLCALAALSAYGAAGTTRDAIDKSDLIIVGDVVGGQRDRSRCERRMFDVGSRGPHPQRGIPASPTV